MATIVQHTPKARTATSGGTPNTVAFTYAGGVTAGDFLFVILAIGTSAGATGVADSLGQTWLKAISKTQSTITCEIWYKENTAAGTPTVTITIGGTSAINITGELGEASGIASASSLDQTASAAGSLTTALITGNTGPLANSTELYLAGWRNFERDWIDHVRTEYLQHARQSSKWTSQSFDGLLFLAHRRRRRD